MQITKFFSILFISSFILVSCSNEDDSTALDAIMLANKKPLGTSANDLLSDVNYTKLTVEIVSVKGFEPTKKAITSFKAFLENRLHKPDGINIIQRSVASTKLAPFSIEEIARIENNNRIQFTDNKEITVYIYFADGSNQNDTNTHITLGTAYLNTSIVIYENTIRELSAKSNSPLLSTIEAATLNHEFAHLLGLININTTHKSKHENHTSKGHCSVKKCLMAAALEFETGIMNIVNGDIPILDPLCLADLKSNGGR